LVGKLWLKNVIYYIFKFIKSARKVIFYKRLHVALEKEAKMLVYICNNLFDSPDFWCVRLSPLFSKTNYALTGAPVAKCVVSMLSCVTCVFLYLFIFLKYTIRSNGHYTI